MSSDRSEFGRRRPPSDGRSGQWDRRDDGPETRRESHRGSLRDACRTQSPSPERRDSRDWDQRSPLRRPAAEKRWPRHSEDGRGEDGHRCERDKRTRRQSADAPPHTHARTSRDFEHRASPQKSRPRRRLEDSENHRRHHGVPFRRRSAGHRDGSPEANPEIPVKPPRVPDSLPAPPPAPLEHVVCSADLWHNGSRQQAHGGAVNTQHAKVPKQEQMKGFQRFLDVLNRGVNVDTLTKIVTQTPTDHFHQPSNLLPRSVDHPWTSNHVSPQHNGRSLHMARPDEEPPRSGPGRDQVKLQDRTTPVPDDQNKCRQVHDVLQAIGMDLGFEELGQMSSRINERLYGRKDGNPGHRVSVETGSKLPRSPRHRSGSSSSRSSFTPLPRDGGIKRDSLSTERQQTQNSRSAEHHLDLWPQWGQYRRNSGSLQAESCDSASPQQSAAPLTYTPAEPSPSVRSPQATPPSTPALLCSPLPPPSSAVLPHLAPGMFLHQRLPSFLSAALGQRGPSFTNPPPADLLPNPLPLGQMLPKPSPLNPPRAKGVARQRCLQVIQTKPG